MKKLLKMVSGMVLLLALLTVAGCEWSSGGDSSWSGAPDWVNFSGVYRGAGGGVLVTDYTATPGTPGTTNTVANEHFATADGVNCEFSGVLNNDSILPGSVQVNVTGFSLSDDGSGALSGNNGSTGAIDYGTGGMYLNFAGIAPSSGEIIYVSYQYTVAGTQGSGSADPGTSGIVIYTFTVHQQGNTLEITDNNGSVYKGKFGDVSTTSGGTGGTTDEDGNVVYEAGSTAVAQYSVEGVSAAGMNVTMTGTMQGVLATAGGVFADRIMIGTWIEKGGRTGDINGQASPIAVTGDTTSTN